MTTHPTFTIFILLRAAAPWLRLTHEERSKAASAAFAPWMKDHPDTKIRYFDAEAFSGRCSDILQIETDNLAAHCGLMDRLRDSDLFTVPYYELIDIIPSVEDTFRASNLAA